MDLNAGQLIRCIYSGLMQWTNGAYRESWTFAGMTLSEMPTSVALPTSHHFHPSLSPVISVSVGILHKWMRTQMLAKPSLNLLHRTGGDYRGSHVQPGWRTFMMICLSCILGYMRLEIWHKSIGLSADWCLCTALLLLDWIDCCAAYCYHYCTVSTCQSWI